MQLEKVEIKNFRLLQNVQLLLEKTVTVIVGRNNTGKTSLTEVMRRVLQDTSATFRLEDFSFSTHQEFWGAFVATRKNAPEAHVRKLLPVIEVRLTFAYEKNEELGLLNDFIVDLDPACTKALIVMEYGLKEGRLKDLFVDLVEKKTVTKVEFFRTIRERIPALYGPTYIAVDPNDVTNQKPVEASAVRAVCAGGCISAQRGLDDATHKDRVVIGKVLESLFSTAKANADDEASHKNAKDLELAVREIQERISGDFNKKLDGLLPALSRFGYPGLSGSALLTETTLDVEKLLTNNTKIRYVGANGIHLPEAYNGLGARNIILILLQLREQFKLYSAMRPQPAVHLIFVEEPEVHLHPQMQEVFIRKLDEIADLFRQETNLPWPIQFVVSTHSSHVANEARFEAIRYFLSQTEPSKGQFSIIKDLRLGLGQSEKTKPERDFLHQYMTLTRCDLFFADKAVLIEGTSERLLLPRIIQKLDAAQGDEGKKLGSQYLSIIEVGGAYAHLFFDLLAFLELQTLVITDIDAVEPNDKGKWVGCTVRRAKRTSNACINSWFSPKTNLSPADLILETDAKIKGNRRIAFQIPEIKDGPCGRSLEDAFMLANMTTFAIEGATREEQELDALEKARDEKKAAFALKYALGTEEWNIPHYIREGIEWLAGSHVQPGASAAKAAQGTTND